MNMDPATTPTEDKSKAWELTPDHHIAWAKVKSLIEAFQSLERGGEPKMAATALGKAYEAAKLWARLADPKGED